MNNFWCSIITYVCLLAVSSFSSALHPSIVILSINPFKSHFHEVTNSFCISFMLFYFSYQLTFLTAFGKTPVSLCLFRFHYLLFIVLFFSSFFYLFVSVSSFSSINTMYAVVFHVAGFVSLLATLSFVTSISLQLNCQGDCFFSEHNHIIIILCIFWINEVLHWGKTQLIVN